LFLSFLSNVICKFARVFKVAPIYGFDGVSFVYLFFNWIWLCYHVFFSHVVFFLNMLLNFIKLMDLFTCFAGTWVLQVFFYEVISILKKTFWYWVSVQFYNHLFLLLYS
jgi:hypothetical protein